MKLILDVSGLSHVKLKLQVARKYFYLKIIPRDP